jgi:two-component system, response regulator YesN
MLLDIRMTKTFRKFLLSYILILLIPNISGYISYRVSIHQAEAGSIETSLILLGQTKSILERRMAEIDGFTKELALHHGISSLLYQDVQNDTYTNYSLWKTWVDFNSFGRSNDFLQNYFIYLKKSNVVLSPGSIFYRPEHFYELNHDTGQTYEQWLETLRTTQQSTVIPRRSYITGDTNETSVIKFVQPLPLNSVDSPQGSVVVTIDERQIIELLDSIPKQFGGWAFITDRGGSILTQIGIDDSQIQAMELDLSGISGTIHHFLDDGSLLITTRSETTGWLYAAQIPKMTLFGKADAIRNITLSVTTVAFVAGVLISLFLAHRNSKPILRLVGAIREQLGLEENKGYNDFDFLQGNISMLISNSKRLEEELAGQIPLLRDSLLKRLIRGEMSSPGEMESAMSQAGLELHGPHGFVGMILINGYGGMVSQEIFREMNAARLIVKHAMQETVQKLCQMTDWESDKMALLLTFPEEPVRSSIEQVEEQFRLLLRQLEEDYRLSITICMGAPFASLSEISRSYVEAKEAMDYAAFHANFRTVWYEHLEKEASTFYYPIDLELRLLHAMKAGEWPEVQRIMGNIYEKNFTEGELTPDRAQELYIELRGTLLKLLEFHLFRDTGEREAVRRLFTDIPLADSPQTVKGHMEAVMESFCGMIAQRRTDTFKETVSHIMKLLETMYVEPDLTVYKIAKHVGRPEKYITQLFKEHMGDTIADRLEQIRIRKATELLIQQELTIEEIAERVGYNSAHSFRRAFKRISGISPSHFRTSAD